MSESYLEIQLNQQPIELCKLLKIADLVTGGGEAKVAISEGYVILNGEVEYQKRKKIYHNDIVEFNGDVIQVIINEDISESIEPSANDKPTNSPEAVPPLMMEPEKLNEPNHSKKTKNKAIKKAVPVNEGTANRNKRKPISF